MAETLKSQFRVGVTFVVLMCSIISHHSVQSQVRMPPQIFVGK